MPVDLLSDPVVRTFTDKEHRGWLLALADACRYERDGLYSYAGSAPPYIAGLITKGGLIPVEPEVPGIQTFEVYAWAACVETKEAIERKRAESKERKERFKNKSPNASGTRSVSRANAKGSNSLSTSEVNGSQEPTSGRRDLAYEALGDCWQGDWHGLPNDARGRINEALGSLRNMTENRDRDEDALAAEIRTRWATAETWKADWQWTPQTFLRYWRKLAAVKTPAAAGEGDPATFVGTPEWNAARDAEYARTVGLG